MSLSDGERDIIVRRELEKAERTFGDAQFCVGEQRWETAANRLYYALFHAMSPDFGDESPFPHIIGITKTWCTFCTLCT